MRTLGLVVAFFGVAGLTGLAGASAGGPLAATSPSAGWKPDGQGPIVRKDSAAAKKSLDSSAKDGGTPSEDGGAPSKDGGPAPSRGAGSGSPRGHLRASIVASGARPQAAGPDPGPASVAYLEGKQALVGLHAASTEPPPRDASGREMLALRTVNRGEYMAIAAGRDGGFDSLDLDRVAHLLRAAGGEEHPVDPRTLSLVYRVQVHFRVPEIRVVSGYRMPKPGSHSNHGKGRAMDVIVPGIPDEEVARFAREIGFVGVGLYPRSQFVHLDIRPRSYFWVDYSGPKMRNREHGILADLARQSDAAALARGEPPVPPFAIGSDVEAALRTQGAPPSPEDASDDEDEESPP